MQDIGKLCMSSLVVEQQFLKLTGEGFDSPVMHVKRFK